VISLTNHSAIVCDSRLPTSVTISSCDRQKNARLVSNANGQLSTHTRAILLWPQPSKPTAWPGLRPVLLLLLLVVVVVVVVVVIVVVVREVVV